MHLIARCHFSLSTHQVVFTNILLTTVLLVLEWKPFAQIIRYVEQCSRGDRLNLGQLPDSICESVLSFIISLQLTYQMNK